MYENLKNGKYIAKYIPEYPKGHFPEIEFLRKFSNQYTFNKCVN